MKNTYPHLYPDSPKQAIFLDRDGTLIEDRGYLRSPSEVVFYDDTIPALQMLQRIFKLFIVTNQQGIAEGVLRPEEVNDVHEFILGRFARFGIRIEQVYCCPHRRADGCRCIKPNIFFLQEAARAHRIDLRASFVIGDHPHDVEFARKAGATGIYMLTGHGLKHRAELQADVPIAASLWEAANMVIKGCDLKKSPPDSGNEIMQAAAILRQGGVVAFPTETVYGLGANAFDAEAVARVFEIKQRPRFDPLIVHVGDQSHAESVVSHFPEKAKDLAQRFWPGPLTLVLPKSKYVPEIVTAGLPSVAVRMPDHPLALALIREAGIPLAAPSANPFGRISPTRADHVRKHLGDQVDRVIDGGQCQWGIESTVISLAGEEPTLLRLGALPMEEVMRVMGCDMQVNTNASHPSAPGQLPQHYAPRTPLVLRRDIHGLPHEAHVGLLSFRSPDTLEGFAAVEVLSPTGDLREAAANLFAMLHRLDAMNLDLIVTEYVPDRGLGLAINDRIRRAIMSRVGTETEHI